eukprot:TRINITY_DN20968_c3_g1_i1.p1 TRINITY_DN20968_c3_g1~~TRINITY_DN20968_c3_g1_i1.p1  ORF type:complete len:390 (+),score=72.33 TRINITY_DN20968_c3_g1_i1:2-1171(+)
MSAWSMLAVELLHPIMLELEAEGRFSDCDWCGSVFSSVMRANLHMFATVIATDNWSQVSVPLILHSPWTAIILIGAVVTLMLGVVNLVLAVVVDEFAEARERDVKALAEEMEDFNSADMRFLRTLFDRIDADGDGELSIDEVKLAAMKNSQFRDRLRVMDIDEQDLEQFFDMVDADGSGSVEPEEFNSALSRWMTESRTASRFVKYNLMRSMVQLGDVQTAIADLEKQVRNLCSNNSTGPTRMVSDFSRETSKEARQGGQRGSLLSLFGDMDLHSELGREDSGAKHHSANVSTPKTWSRSGSPDQGIALSGKVKSQNGESSIEIAFAEPGLTTGQAEQDASEKPLSDGRDVHSFHIETLPKIPESLHSLTGLRIANGAGPGSPFRDVIV